MSLLRYAISGILRNRRRTFSAVLGVLLAVTFIAGTFIAIDSSARATLDAALSNVAGDFSYSANPLGNPPFPIAVVDGSALRNALAGVPGITDVSVYSQLYGYTGRLGIYEAVSGSPNTSWFVQSLTAVDPHHLPYAFRQATVAGSLVLPNGTLAMDSDTARSIGVEVNGSVVLVNQVGSAAGPANFNLPFKVGAILTFPSPSYGYYPGPYPFYSSVIAFNLRDAPFVDQRLNLTGSSLYGAPALQGEIWVDRDRYVNPYDIGASTFQLTRLGRSLNAAILAASYVGSVNDNLSPVLTSFSGTLFVQRVQYLFLSAPVILLGLYLGAVGVDLGHAERRRELGVLKTRGASPRQVGILLITESILGGFVATVLGLIFGIALSRLLIGVVTPFGTSAAFGTVSLTPDTIIGVTILSTIFMAVASYRSARRTSSLPIIETLRYYAPGETHAHYSPTADVAMIGFSVFVYAMLLYYSSSAATSPSGEGFFIYLIVIPLLFALPITPILLVVGLTRLITRWSGRVYEWTSHIIRPFAKNLGYVVSRNLSRNPRRSSSIAIIIALGLAFGIFVVTFYGSQQAMQEQSLRANVGADLSIVPPFTTNASAGASFGTNLSQVSGISQVTHLGSISAQVIPGTQYGSPSIYAIDPTTYFAVSQPASYFFEDPASQAGAQQVLATKGQVLITGRLARDAALQVGDPLLMITTSYANNTTVSIQLAVHVGGIVRFLPGTFPGFFYGAAASAPEEVYGSFATFASLIAAQEGSGIIYGGSDRYLASLQPGADWRTVKADVLAMGVTSVQVYQEQLAQIVNNPFLGAFLGFIRMEIAFIVVVLTAGLALIIYAASLERTVEFAGITARGSSGWQTAGLLVGEAFVIMLIGVVIGFLVGLLTGFLSVTATTPSLGGAEPIVPNVFSFPLEGLLLVVLAPVAMLGTTVVVAWRIARMNVARVLKMRGG